MRDDDPNIWADRDRIDGSRGVGRWIDEHLVPAKGTVVCGLSRGCAEGHDVVVGIEAAGCVGKTAQVEVAGETVEARPFGAADTSSFIEPGRSRSGQIHGLFFLRKDTL